MLVDTAAWVCVCVQEEKGEGAHFRVAGVAEAVPH